MHKKLAVAATATAVGIAVAGGGFAVAGSSDDEGTLTGPQAQAATKAALEATGGGRANSVERDSENGATWEVEVTRTDGDTVDVRLDAAYEVVVIEGDSDARESGS